MRLGWKTLVAGASVSALAVAGPALPAAAGDDAGDGAGGAPGGGVPAAIPPDPDPARAQQAEPDLPNPLAEKQFALRQKALHQVLRGEAQVRDVNGSKVVKVGEAPDDAAATQQRSGRDRQTRARPVTPQDQARERSRGRGDQGNRGERGERGEQSQYVELERENTDRIFTIIAEFGDERHPNYPDLEPDPRPNPAQTFDGPLHNQIERPNRLVNNVTIWQEDYDREHYQDLYFGSGRDSLKSYFEKQSSGRYSVNGMVTDWVKVQYNEARYGRNVSYDEQGNVTCQSIVCNNVWYLIRDAVDSWVQQQREAGKTTAEIQEMLSAYDEWDRYDHDGDGNFNERDGYLDHFQIIHAGQGEAVGGGVQGEDSIWSHRWYAFGTNAGQTGPSGNQLGGTEIGDTGIWVGDYTMQPENGGLGVFAHEYAHDLGLPDLYDTSGLGENSVSFWGLMSSGSYLGPGDEALGTRPGDFLAWSKLQLGWLDYEVTYPRQKEKITLGPAEFNTKRPQANVVVLPEKKKTVELADPPQGENAWWSTMGDDLDTSMRRELTLPEDPATMTLQTWYSIETDFDFAYMQLSADGGESWTDLVEPITGSSDGWQEISIDLSEWAGQNVQFRVNYVTDGAVIERGIMVDDIRVTAGDETVFAGGAESGTNGWTLDGFTTSTGTEVSYHPTYYIAANREYVSYDEGLRTGPYQFGFPNTRPNFVGHFPYQDGLLVSYWDSSQTNNNVGQHPGEGLVLPVDAHPRPLKAPNGDYWRTRIQAYDATFGHQFTDRFVLHQGNVPDPIRPRRPARVFDDRDKYWYEANPDAGVKLPGTGTKIRVQQERGDTVRIKVDTKKVPY